MSLISSFHIKRKRNCRDSYSNLYLNYAEQCDMPVGTYVEKVKKYILVIDMYV